MRIPATVACLVALVALPCLRALSAQEAKVPTADAIFAKLRERAQRLKGLRCTLEIQSCERRPETQRKRLEFRAPGHLRLERLAKDDTPLMQAWFRPEVSVVTPRERWTYLPRRDEVITGAWEPSTVSRGKPEGWEKAARVLAALLAPDAFYREFPVRRVFPDTLNGRRCYQVLVAKPGLRADRIWIDPERWTVLKVRLAWRCRWSEPFYECALDVVRHREIAPGFWLPSRIVHVRILRGTEVARVRAVEVGHVPADECFAPPGGIPLLRRSAAATPFERTQILEMTDKMTRSRIERLHRCYLDPKATGDEDTITHLKRFITRNPRIRAAYYELAQRYYRAEQRDEGHRTIEAAAKLWPDDLRLRGKVLLRRYWANRTLENAERAAPFMGTTYALETRLRAQTEAGQHEAAKRTARELIDHMESLESKHGLGSRILFEAAEKGGWLDELRQESERRAAADPPSEVHLRFLIFLARSDRAKCTALWAQLAEARRDSPDVQVECATVLGSSGPEHIEQAVDLFARLLDSLPGDDFVRRSRAQWGLANMRRGTRRGARRGPDPVRERLEADLARRAGELSKAQRLWRCRELADWCRDEPDEAIAWLARAIGLAPDDESLKFRLLAALLRAGQRAEAIQLFESLLKDHRGRPELWLAWRRNLSGDDAPELVQQVLDGLLACAPTEPETFGFAKDTCAAVGRYREAARWALQQANAGDRRWRLLTRLDAARHLVQAEEAQRAIDVWLPVLREALHQWRGHQKIRPRMVSEWVRPFGDPKLVAERDAGWLRAQWLPALRAVEARSGDKEPPVLRAALHFAIGSAHRALGQADEAVEHYARGVKLMPDFKPGLRWLGELAPGYKVEDF